MPYEGPHGFLYPNDFENRHQTKVVEAHDATRAALTCFSGSSALAYAEPPAAARSSTARDGTDADRGLSSASHRARPRVVLQ
jgi:hypothetical protein